MKWELVKKSLIITMAAGAFMGTVSANEDPLLSATGNVVNTDQIDVDGLFNKPKPVSAADKIQKYRRDLEHKHEQMMRKKVEDMRLEEERRIAKKLEKALSGQMQAMDSLSTTQSSVQKVQAKMPVESEAKPNKFSFSGGFMSFSGEQEVDANLNLKASFETDVSDSFAVGMSIRYVNIEMRRDKNQPFQNNLNSAYYGYNTAYYGYNAQNTVGFGNVNQNFKYNSFAFTVLSKFYITKASKIRPYIGAGLSYNRGSIKNAENDDNNQYYSTYQVQSEKVAVNNLGGQVMAGGEVMFNDMFGADLYVQYDRSFTSSIESDFSDTTNENVLKNLARDLEDSNVFSINAGLSFYF